MTRWGLIGCGKQGARYLEPKNNGGRNVVGFVRGVRVDADAVVIATPPATHAELAIDCIDRGIAVLLEKPAALTWRDCERIFEAADKPGAPPLVIASPHLYSRKFLDLGYSRDAEVIWAGPERADGSCPAYLDYGPHAWAMATALGTERVITGSHPTRLFTASSNGKQYQGEWLDTESPMLAMVETMERLMSGGFDWRSGKTFTRALYSKLFANMPGRPCNNEHAGVNKTTT